MKHKSFIRLILFVLTLFWLNSLFAATIEETWKKKIDFKEGGLIRVENTNGSIVVEGWDRDEVQIEAVKKARAGSRKEAARLMDRIIIDISQSSGELAVRTELPRGGGGSFWDWIFGGGRSTQVQYKIFVPVRSDLKIETTNGRITVSEISGRLKLRTTNGKIRVEEISGQVDARTTNGSIVADFNRLDESSDMGFYTTNGSIKIYLPSDVRCDLRAKTTNGSINSDFPVEIQGKFTSKRLTGSINGGGALIELRTTNGSISIYQK